MFEPSCTKLSVLISFIQIHESEQSSGLKRTIFISPTSSAETILRTNGGCKIEIDWDGSLKLVEIICYTKYGSHLASDTITCE